MSKQQTNTSVKSLVMEAVRGEAKLVDYDQLPKKLANYFLQEFEQLDEEYSPGFAIFAKFKAEQIDRSSQAKVGEGIEYLLVHLGSEPDKSVYVGKAFDLTPLLANDAATIQAVILSVDRQSAQIYSLKYETLTEIMDRKNALLVSPEDEALNMFTGVGTGEVFHGNGKDKLDRRNDRADYKFAEEMIAKLRDVYQEKGPWKQVVVFSSTEQRQDIEELIEQEFTTHTNHPVMFVNRHPSTPAEVRNFAREEIKQAQDDLHLSLADDVVEDKPMYALGWTDVSLAVREGRVDCLLITPEAKQSGYVVSNSYPSTIPEEDAMMVKNVAPWLTMAVIRTGGDVYANEYIPKVTQEVVAAKLRW